MDKQYILDEIKRTAAANGGAPLGRKKLFLETGIRDADWEAYWPRFSEAVREAGLEPNKMTAGYAEGVLIEKLIALVRERGRFPVHRELKLKARTDSSFPADKTFARMGDKQQRIAKVIAYCKGREGYDDVIAMCTPSAQVRETMAENSREPSEVFGFVYLMKSGRFFKIGRTNAVGRRERELAIQLPEKANVVHSIRTDDPSGIEAYWHGRFAPKRKNGEWFDLDVLDVKAFRRRKFM